MYTFGRQNKDGSKAGLLLHTMFVYLTQLYSGIEH